MSQNLSVRAGLFCLGAITTALLAVIFAPYVPDDMAELLGGDAVDHILTILASSMLAVVTFSLSTLIASYSVAGTAAPARATSLIMRDKSAQNALSTFLGAFIFSVVALVALSTKYYGPKGRVILFIFMILVLGAVIWTVIRWIGQLSRIGQLSNVIRVVEKTAMESIQNQPQYFLETSQTRQVPNDAFHLTSKETGFVQTLDLNALSEIADQCKVEIWLSVHAGEFVYPGAELACIQSKAEQKDFDKIVASVSKCILIGKQRTFEDDPRFGFIVLSEIASRALSPGINDPGTAIEIIGSLLRLIGKVHSAYEKPCERSWSNALHLWPVTPEEILDDAFQAVSRDGAAIVEVGIFLQKALVAIESFPKFKEAAQDRARRSLEMATNSVKSKHDVDRLLRASRASAI